MHVEGPPYHFGCHRHHGDRPKRQDRSVLPIRWPSRPAATSSHTRFHTSRRQILSGSFSRGQKPSGSRTVLMPILTRYLKSSSVMKISQCFSRTFLALSGPLHPEAMLISEPFLPAAQVKTDGHLCLMKEPDENELSSDSIGCSTTGRISEERPYSVLFDVG